ncbi:MAG: hypothetical protein HY721_31130 [Planctomycetes bacterium]|nr:hypothetical protein [Planctomycetota bacterium]
MNHILFQSLDDCLEFLVACERGQTPLGKAGREVYTRIGVHLDKPGEPCYSIAFEDSQWDGSGFLYGGEVKRCAPLATVISANQLLEHVPLRAWMAPPPRLQSFVLACRIEAGYCAPAEAQGIVRRAWRDVPKTERTESGFYLTNGTEQPGWSLVQIDHVAASFKFHQFRKRHTEKRLQVFVPAWSEEGCFLFVEWGYEYPRHEDFYMLYEEPDSGILLCAHGDPVPQPPGVDHGSAWHVPKWFTIDGEPFTAGDGIRLVLPSHSTKVAHLKLRQGGQPEALDVRLAQGEAERAVGALGEIERQVGMHERALDELYSRRERLRARSQQEYIPIYAFFQRPQTKRLPVKLEHFLSRPLAEQAGFSYAQGVVEGKAIIHYIIGEFSVPRGAALSVPCDQVYLQDSRWEAWNLPLFVRSDISLNLEVDEEGVAAKLRELLEAEDLLGDGESRVLVGPAAESGVKRGARRGGPLSFWSLSPAKKLPQVYHYTNAQGEGAESVRDSTSEALGREAALHGATAEDKVKELDAKLHAQAKRLLEEAETNWERVRQEIREVSLRARLGDTALKATDECYAAFPDQWKAFVMRVLEVDRQVSLLKSQALERWRAAEAERQGKLDKVKQDHADVSSKIKAAEHKFNETWKELQSIHAELAEKIKEVEALKKRIEDEMTAVAAALENQKMANSSLEKRKGEYDGVIKALEREVEACRKHLDELAARKQKMEQERESLKELRGEVDRLQGDWEKLKQEATLERGKLRAELPRLERLAEAAMRAIKKIKPPPPPEAPSPPPPKGFLARLRRKLFRWRGPG